jgi:hypothetical protein
MASSKSSIHKDRVLNYALICLAALAVAAGGCTDEEVQRVYPRVRTLEVTNVTKDGVTFIAEIYDEGNVGITEHGFTWAVNSPDMTVDERVYLGSFSGTGKFEAVVTTALEEEMSYEVCAFVKAGDFTVYGEKIKFMSLGSGAPEITGFIPSAAGWGDTVTVTGRKFSHRNSTDRIYVEDRICIPFYASDTLLRFILPPEVQKPLNTLSVNILGNVATAAEKLVFNPPEFFGFAPVSGYWGDTIVFDGRCLNFFGHMISDAMILNSSLICKAVRYDDDSIYFVIPGQLNTASSPVALSYRTIPFSFPQSLTLLPPEADSLSTHIGTWGTLVTLYGRFNYMTERNRVMFGDKVAPIVSSSCDSLVVRVPDNLTEYVTTVRYESEPFASEFSESFNLQEPGISDFDPKSGYSGVRVAIRGRYFRKDFLTAAIGGRSVIIRSVSDTVIQCHVPGDVYGECTLTVTSLGHTVVAEELFTSTNHTITGIYPLNVTYGDTVTVTGTDLRPGITISLGTDLVSLASLSNQEIRFVIPDWMRYDHHTVTARHVYSDSPFTFTSSFTAADQLQLKDFTVSGFTPMSASAGDLLVISGSNLGIAHVFFGSTEAEVTASSPTELEVRVPVISSGDHEIRVTIGGRTHVCPQMYTHNSPWRRLDDLPFLYENACVLDFGDDAYVITGGETGLYEKEIYRFDPASKEFTKLPGNYSSSVLDPIPCTLNGKGYIIGAGSPVAGGGFEVFNPDSMTLRMLPEFPGTRGVNRCLVADDSVIYAGGGKIAIATTSYWYRDFWKYSPATNTWTRLADIPLLVASTNQVFLDGRLFFVGFPSPTGEKYLLEYHPLTNTWSQAAMNTQVYGSLFLRDFSKGARVSVINNGKWYIGFGDWYQTNTDSSYERSDPGINNSLYTFDPAGVSYSQIINVAVSRRPFALSFSSGGKLYIGGSQIYHYYDFWEYDPQLDQ